ncbi:MAG: lysylphosphatidylglycerol synthase domain-containing protein [Beijerinckiaceae bacterium]
MSGQEPPHRGRYAWLGTVAGLALFGISAAVLYVIVSELDANEIRAAFAAASFRQIMLAIFLAAISYLLLTGYDAIGFRQLGYRVPYRTTALGSYTSYAVSFTLGFPLITGGTVRYWIYSAVGIGAKSIASLTLIAGVTFWLGMGVVLGACLIWKPAEIAELSRLPAAANALLGVGILGVIAAYLFWVSAKPRSLTFQGWSLKLPNLKISLAQMLIGALDVCAAGAACYVLLPQGYGITYGAFISAYVFACILGIASHAPGGIGVFEATIILALPNVPTEQLLGSLLLFRLYYYIVPFIIALLLLATREIVLRWRILQSDMAHAAQRGPGSGDGHDRPRGR